MSIWLFLVVFVSATCLDYCHGNYIMAVEKREAWYAALWSSLQWCAGVIGFLVAVKISLWALPAEVLGLTVGTVLSVRRASVKVT
jgi:hypothetical protein